MAENDAATPTPAASGVALSLSTEYSFYTADTAVETVVGAHFQAPAAPSAAERAPVDCVVVCDVSGSMQGAKLNLMKETIKLLLSEFSGRDRVGLVTFDTSVNEPLALTNMDEGAKVAAGAVASSLQSGSSTNLSGGCFAGIQALLNAGGNNSGAVRTVLLMTDGQANHGLTKATEIVPVLEGMMRGSGITLHTFGYGADHDSMMLRSLATAGSGSYYFVEGVDDIRTAFADCLGGILSVVAQNLQLEIEACNGTTIAALHHKSAVCVAAGQRYRVPFADLYGEEQRDVLVRVLLPACAPVKDALLPEAAVLRATLRYIDVVGKAPGEARAEVGSARTSGAAAGAVRNPELALQAARLQVAATLEDARGIADRGDLAGARARIAAAEMHIAALGAETAGLKSAEAMLPAFVQDLRECRDGLRDRETYRSKQHDFASMAEGHAQQRCMSSKVASANVYRTSNKGGMAAKWSAPPSVVRDDEPTPPARRSPKAAKVALCPQAPVRMEAEVPKPTEGLTWRSFFGGGGSSSS
jgi:hypothetical protein